MRDPKRTKPMRDLVESIWNCKLLPGASSHKSSHDNSSNLEDEEPVDESFHCTKCHALTIKSEIPSRSGGKCWRCTIKDLRHNLNFYREAALAAEQKLRDKAKP